MKNLVVCFKDKPVEDYLIERIKCAWDQNATEKINIINTDQSGVSQALFEADYFCGHAKVPVDWNGIVAQNRLRWVQSSAAGMDWLLVPSVIASKITITTAAGVLADQVSEHGLALILAWIRNLPAFLADQFCSIENPDYRQFRRKPTRDLTGLTVGIVGFGGVGRRFSQLVSPFTKRIIAIDLFPSDKPSQVQELWNANQLDDLLAISDVVFLSLPLNESTKGIFNADKLGKMKKGSLLANMARGALVQTDALVDALKSGHLAGAIMDVTSPEPLPPNHPLWDFENVLITPHVGGQIRWRFEDICDIYCENIRRFHSNEPLINQLSQEGKRLGFPIRDGITPLWIDVKDNYSTR